MAWLILSAWICAQTPDSWRIVHQSGAAPQTRNGRIQTAFGAAAKWLIDGPCMLFLGPDAEVQILAPRPGECARIKYIRGNLRAAAAGALFAILLPEREVFLENDVFETAEAPDAMQAWDVKIPRRDEKNAGFSWKTALSPQGFASHVRHLAQEYTQTGGGGAMCLDSSKSAGDVGNSSSTIIQLPPRARLFIQVPLPAGR